MRVPTPLLLLGLFACAKGPNLEPAPEATATGARAYDTDAGVTMSVDPHTWTGFDLDDYPELVEVHVEIDNNARRPLLLKPEYVSLVASDGRVWQAVDPSRPDMVDLDMKNELFERATVERIIEDVEDVDNEDIEGNVYFRGIDQSEARYTFRARLVDARTREAFGMIEIPLINDDVVEEQRVSLSGR